MDLGLALHEVGAGERPEHFARFTAAIDPAWIDTALAVTGTATVRRRRLPHERWELELAFDEIKTHTLEREETLRSRSPERVYQEIWGLAIAYNLVRWHMQRIARRLDLPPVRISYHHTLVLLRGFWLTVWHASPGVVPRRLADLDVQSALLTLPPRRPHRRYPRAVKVKMTGYRRKH